MSKRKKEFHEKARLLARKQLLEKRLLHMRNFDADNFYLTKKVSLDRFQCKIYRQNKILQSYIQITRLMFVNEAIRLPKTKQAKQKQPKNLKCKICGETFESRAKLNLHVRTHTGEKPYKCSHCPYASGWKQNLNSHIKHVHLGEKPFKCTKCDFATAYRHGLKIHEQKHTAKPEYACEMCEFMSFTQHKMTVHMAKHTGGKPFKCMRCNFASSNCTSLSQHTKTHVGQKYSCSLCSYTSISYLGLSQHAKRHKYSEVCSK